MSRKVLPVGTVFMVLVIFLALLGVGYALWSETLTISGTVNTGEVDVELIDVVKEECVDVWGVGECQAEPALKVDAANCTLDSSGSIDGSDGIGQLAVTVDGMYPSWHCKVAFKVKSSGNVPVHVALPVAQVGKDNPGWVATNFADCYEDGVQLHQGESTSTCTIDIHFTNDVAPDENSGPYTFGWDIKAVQWNEDGEPGYPPVAQQGYQNLIPEYAARFRALSNTGSREIYVGLGDVTAGLRNEADALWVVGDNAFTFSYDAGTGLMSASVTNSNGTFAPAPYPFASNATCTGDLVVMDMFIKQANLTAAEVKVRNLNLNGTLLGDSFEIFDVTNKWNNHWTITGENFSDGFTLTGVITLTGPQPLGDETNVVQFSVGCLP